MSKISDKANSEQLSHQSSEKRVMVFYDNNRRPIAYSFLKSILKTFISVKIDNLVL